MADDWEAWRRDRQRELVAGGMSRSLARRWARAEMKGRARIAKMTGFVAAASAPLDFQDREDGSTSWRILLDPDQIPAGRRMAVHDFLFGSASAARN
jgi:hypothetical protein